MSELVLLGWWWGLRPYYTLKLRACQRLIVGWNPEYCQYRQGAGLGVFKCHYSAIVSGDEAMKPRVLGLVNHTLTTAAEFFVDAVVRDCLAD